MGLHDDAEKLTQAEKWLSNPDKSTGAQRAAALEHCKYVVQESLDYDLRSRASSILCGLRG
jgi:hypothetical protein